MPYFLAFEKKKDIEKRFVESCTGLDVGIWS